MCQGISVRVYIGQPVVLDCMQYVNEIAVWDVFNYSVKSCLLALFERRQ
jgi:hypothetical protein